MTDADGRAIPRAVHDAAADWLEVRQRGPSVDVEACFAQWIDADPAHRSAYAQIAADWHDGTRLSFTELGRRRDLPRAPIHLRRSTHVAAASLCLLAVIGVSSVLVIEPGGPFSLVSPAQAATFETGVGEIRRIALADGSTIVLDTNSRISVAIGPRERRITLRGRARFVVATDRSHPFVVQVRTGTVVARGTMFDVATTDGVDRVSLFRGSIEIYAAAVAEAASPPITLHAGQQATVAVGVVPTPITATEGRWVSGMLALDETPLADAITAINRYNRVQLRLGDRSLERLRLSGAYRARDAEAFAHMVAALYDLRRDRAAPDQLVLYPQRVAARPPEK